MLADDVPLVAIVATALAALLVVLWRDKMQPPVEWPRAFNVSLLERYVEMLLSERRATRAVEITSLVAEHEPNNLRVRLLLVKALIADDQIDAAITHLEELRTLRPGSEEVVQILDELRTR